MSDFISKLPKAELHLHLEGTLEPEMMLEKAKKNGVKLPYKSIEDVKNAYKFKDLQSFLD
ncbi:MAG: adenosine deaminase, partial [Nitrososphaeria archaeon]